MRRLLVYAGLIAALVVGAAVAVRAQENPEIVVDESEQRYYIGIGIKPWKILEGVSGFSGPNDTMINNENGRFTGLIMVGRVLKDGPADRAGLTPDDVIVSYDGTPVERLGVEGMSTSIQIGREGNPVRFTLRRFINNHELGDPFDVSVPRAKLDSVAWLPLGMDGLYSSQCSGPSGGPSDGCVEVATKISEDKTAGEFVYEFRMENTYKLPRIVTWDALDKVAGGGHSRGVILTLLPNEPQTFILRSKLLPSGEHHSLFCEYELTDINADRWFKELGVRTAAADQKAMVMRGCARAAAFIPRKYLRAKQ